MTDLSHPGAAALAQELTSPELARAILQSSDDCIQVLDGAGCLLAINPGGVRALELADAGGAIGTPWLESWQGPHREAARRAFDTAVAGGRGRFEGFCPTAKGSPRWWDVVLTPLEPGAAGEGRLLAVSRDISERKHMEQTLEQRERYLRAMIEITPECVKVVGEHGALLDMNPAGLRMIEAQSLDQVVGACIFDVIAPEDREAFRAFHERVCAGERGTLRFHIVGLNGTRRLMETHAVPLPGRDGTTTQLGITRDITASEGAAEAIRRSEERFRSLSASSPVGIFTTDTAGRCTYTNARCQSICGFTFEQALDTGWARFVHEEDREQAAAQWFAAANAGREYSGEVRFRHPDGRVRWAHVRSSPMVADDGRLLGHVGTVEDITLRRQVERALAGEKAVLEKIAAGRPLEEVLDTLARESESPSVDAMLCSVLLLDEAGEHLLHGAAPSLPAAYNAAIHGLAIGPTVGSCGTAAFTGQPVFVTDIATHPFWAPFRDLAAQHGLGACCSMPIRDSRGRVTGTIAMYYPRPHSPSEHDRQLIATASHLAGIAIERKRHEEALRLAERRKDEFLAVLSHELRNPLAPLRNSVELLRMSPADEALRGHALGIMQRQLQHMVRLIDDLLDVSRINRGKLELRCEHAELASIIAAALETSRPFIESQGHELDVHFSAEPTYLHADKTRLAQVFANLLNNAAKYTERGGRISVTTEADAREAVVRVRDTGIGIPPGMLTRIFDMFIQVDCGLEKTQGGLGIGLTLAKLLVEMHGGTISAASAGAGHGSEFVVRIPVASAARVPTVAAAREGLGSSTRRRILIADDKMDAAQSLALMLSVKGHEVRVAHDGRHAVETAIAFRPHLALLDLGMPVLNGFDAAVRIRAELGADAPVLVALTGWGQEEYRRRSKEAGFDQHLVKPVEPAALEPLLARED